MPYASARLAGFPARKLLDDFDFAFQASINKRQVAELASCAFVERAENVVLLGPPGVGKFDRHRGVNFGPSLTFGLPIPVLAKQYSQHPGSSDVAPGSRSGP